MARLYEIRLQDESSSAREPGPGPDAGEGWGLVAFEDSLYARL